MRKGFGHVEIASWELVLFFFFFFFLILITRDLAKLQAKVCMITE